MPFPSWDELYKQWIDAGENLYYVNQRRGQYWQELNKQPEFLALTEEERQAHKRALFRGMNEEQLARAEELIENPQFLNAYSSAMLHRKAQEKGLKVEEVPGYYEVHTRVKKNDALQPTDVRAPEGRGSDDPGIYFMKPQDQEPDDDPNYEFQSWRLNDRGEVEPRRGNTKPSDVLWAKDMLETPYKAFVEQGLTPEQMDDGAWGKIKYAFGKWGLSVGAHLGQIGLGPKATDPDELNEFPGVKAQMARAGAETLGTFEEIARDQAQHPMRTMLEAAPVVGPLAEGLRRASYKLGMAEEPPPTGEHAVTGDLQNWLRERAAEQERKQAKIEAMHPDSYTRPGESEWAPSTLVAQTIESAPAMGAMMSPTILGTALSAATRNPSFARAGAVISGVIGGGLSAGDTAQQMRQAGQEMNPAQALDMKDNFAFQMAVEYGSDWFQARNILKAITKPGAGMDLVSAITKAPGATAHGLLDEGGDLFLRRSLGKASRLENRISMITNAPLRRVTQLGYALASLGKNAASEGVEEMLQRIGDDYSVGGYEAVKNDITNTPGDLLREGAIGAIAGGVMTGGMNTIIHGGSFLKALKNGEVAQWMDRMSPERADNVRTASVATQMAALGASRQDVAEAVRLYREGSMEEYNAHVDQVLSKIDKAWESTEEGHVPTDLINNFRDNQFDLARRHGVWDGLETANPQDLYVVYTANQNARGIAPAESRGAAVAAINEGLAAEQSPLLAKQELVANLGMRETPELQERIQSKTEDIISDKQWNAALKEEVDAIKQGKVPKSDTGALVSALSFMVGQSVNADRLVRTMFKGAFNVQKTQDGWTIQMDKNGARTVTISRVGNKEDLRYSTTDEQGREVVVDPKARTVAVIENGIAKNPTVLSVEQQLPQRRPGSKAPAGTATTYKTEAGFADMIQVLHGFNPNSADAGTTFGHEYGHVVVAAYDLLPQEIKKAMATHWGITPDNLWDASGKASKEVEKFVEDVGRYGALMNGSLGSRAQEAVLPRAGKASRTRQFLGLTASKLPILGKFRARLAQALTGASELNAADVLDYLASGRAANVITRQGAQREEAQAAAISEARARQAAQTQAVREQPEAAAQAQPAGEGAGRGVERGVGVQERVSRRQDARPVDFSAGAEIDGIPYRGQTSTMIMYMRPDQYLKLADRYEGPDVADARESLKNGTPLPIPALSVRMSGEVRPGAETLEVTGSKGQAIARVAQIKKAGRIPVSVEMEGGWSDSEVSMAAAGLPLTRSRESGRSKVDPEERFLGDRAVEQMKAPKPTMGTAAREPVAEPGPTTKPMTRFERRTTREHRLVRRPLQEHRMAVYDPATKRWRWLPIPPVAQTLKGPAPRLLRSEIQSELQRAREAHTAAVTRKDPLEAIKQSKLISKLEMELANRTAPKGLDVTGLSEKAAWRKQADQLEEKSRNSTDAAEAAKMLTQAEKLRKMADEQEKKDFEERDRVLKNVGLTREERRQVSVLMEKLFFGDIGTARYKAALKGFRSAAAKAEAVLGTFRAQYPHMGPQIDGVLAALKDRQPGLFSTRANRLNGSITSDDRVVAKQREVAQKALADMNAALRLLDSEYRQNQAGILQASRKEFRPRLQRKTHPATKAERRMLNELDDRVTETLGGMQAYTDAARRDSDEQERAGLTTTRELQVPSFAHLAVSKAERLAREREEAALAEDRRLNPNDQEPDIESMEDDELAELLGVDEKDLEAGRAAFEADQNPPTEEEAVQKRDKYGPETTDLWDPETGMSSDSVHRKIMQMRAEKNAERIQKVRDLAAKITQSPEEMFAAETDPAKKAKAVAKEIKRRKAMQTLFNRLLDIEAGKARRLTVLDAATYLDAWWAQRNRNTGGEPGNWQNPKARERAIRLATKELQWHMQNRGRAGEFWYSRSVDKAIDSIMGKYPELADVTQRGMFKLILAVASATTDVTINWKNAQTAWDAFSTTGNVPNTVRGITDEERKSAAVKQIDRLNKLLAYFREVNGGTLNETAERQLLTFLTTPMSRADILTVMKAAGIYEVSETDGKKTKNYPSTDHSREDGLGYAATMFGNKVGPFFLNMNGITEIPTVDRWMLRAIGRLFGMTVQGRVNGYTGLEMEDAISAPPSGQEDKFMRFAQGFIREVAKKLNMSADDVQAMWWYYEKDLWDALTRTHSSRLRDYEQAAEKTNRIIPQQASLFAEEEMGDAYREGAPVRRAETQAAQDRADVVGDEAVEADRGALGGRKAAESEQLSKEAAKRDVSPEEYAAEVTDLGSEEAVNHRDRVRDWVKDIVPADERADFDAALAVDMLTSLAASAQKVFRNDGIDIYKHGSLARLIGFTHPRLSARMKTALSAVGLTPIAGRHIKNYVPLVQMLRHPLSELATVFFVDNSGRIVDTFVTSARIPGGAPMPLFNQRSVIEAIMDASGATGFFMVHNHPSGDVLPSTGDKSVSLDLSMMKGYMGHLITDATQVYLMKPGEKDKILDVPADWQTKFPTQQQYVARFAERLGYHPPADLNDTMDELQLPQTISKLMNRHQDLKHQSAAWLIFPDSRGRISMYKPIHPNEMNAEAMKAHIDRVMAKLPVYNPFLIFNSASALMRNHDLIAELSQQGHIQRAAAVDSRGRDGYYSVSDAKEAASELRYQAEKAVYAPGVRVKGPAFQRLSARLGAAQTREQNLADAVKNLANVEARVTTPDARLVAEETERANRVVNRVAEKLGIPRGTDQELDAVAEILNRAFGEEGVQERTARDKTSPEYRADLAEATRLQIESIELEKNNRRSPEDAAKYRANQAKLAEYLFTRQVDMADVINSPEYLAALNKQYNEVPPERPAERTLSPEEVPAASLERELLEDPEAFIRRGPFVVLTSWTNVDESLSPERKDFEVKKRAANLDNLGEELKDEKLYRSYASDGMYEGGSEPSFFILNMTMAEAYDKGKAYNQESVLVHNGQEAGLLYTSGPLDGQFRRLETDPAKGAAYGEAATKQPFYTVVQLPNGEKVAFSFGWTDELADRRNPNNVRVTSQYFVTGLKEPNTPAGTDEEGVQTRQRTRSLDMDRSSFERLPYVDKAPGLKMHDGYIWVEDTSVNRPGTVRMVRAYVPTWSGKVYDLEGNEIGTIRGWQPTEPVRSEAVNERQVYRGEGPTVPSEERAAGYGMRMQRPDLDLGALGGSLVRILTNEGSEAEEAARRTGRTFIGEHARKRRRTEELLHKAMDYMANKSEAENMAMIKAMEDNAIDTIQDPKTREIARVLRAELDRRRDEIRALHPGLLETYMDNYFPHIWEMMRNELRMPGKKPVAAPPRGLKHRTVESYEKGMRAGLRPASYNAVELALVQIMDMDRFIKGHQWLYAMQNLGHAVMLPASDAHTAPVGWVQVEYEFGRFLKLNPNYVPGGKEPKYLTSHVMYMNPDAAEIFRRHYNPSKIRNNEWWKFYRNLGNALNQLQLGFSAFHLMFTSIDAASSMMSLAYMQLYHNKGLKKLQALGTGARAFVAPLTNALTGAIVRSDYEGTNRTGARVARFLRDQMPVNVFGLPSEAEAARISKMIERAGGTVGEDPWYFTGGWEQARDAWRQLSRGQLTARDAFYGLTGALWAIPEAVSKPIMSWIVPMQKLGVAYDLMRFELDRLGPSADPAAVDEAMQRAWDSVDNRMGQLVYDNLFWNNTMKELSFGLVRAVGWNLGTLRELGGGTLDLLRNVYNPLFGRERPGFTPRMSYALGMSTFVGMLGLITTCLYGGWEDKDHPEETFGQMLKRKSEEYAKNIAEVGVFAWNDLFLDAFFPRTNEVDAEGNPLRKAYASYMKDVVAWYNDPKQTALHKLHPLLHLIGEQLENRDFNGFRLADPSDPGWAQAKDRVAAFMRGFQPFSMRNMEFINLKLGGEASPFDQVASYVGILPAPAWTGKSEAARYLAGIAYEQTWTQARRDEPVNKKKRLLAAKLRHGTPITKEDYAGLTGEQIDNIYRKTSQPDIINKLKSGGVDPWEAMEAWRRMTKQERLVSMPIVLQKILNRYEATADPDQRAQLDKLLAELTQRKGAK